MSKACVNGVSLHYQQSGQGPDLVLIHGLAANLAFWFLRIVPALNKQYRVTVYDLRGHGKSGTPPTGYTASDMADELRALMDHLEIDSAHLVGHSFGGEVALHCAAFHPDRVTSLTLADSRVRVLQPVQRLKDWADAEWERERIKDLGLWLAEDEPEIGHRLLEECADAALRQGDALAQAGDQRFIPFGSASGGRRSAQRWLDLLRDTSAREDFRTPTSLTQERIAAMDKPVLAVYGERSRCLPSLRELHRIVRRCESITLPGVGHFFPIVQPEVFTAHLVAFLKKVEDGRIPAAQAAPGARASSGETPQSRPSRRPRQPLVAPRVGD